MKNPSNMQRKFYYMQQSLFRLICILLCTGLAACDPWEKDLEKISQAAKKGDKNAMFVIVMNYKDFEKQVPDPLFEQYRMTLIQAGNHEVIYAAGKAEFKEYEKAHPQMDYEQSRKAEDAIMEKWYLKGIENNDVQSYRKLGNLYLSRYQQSHHTADSIKAADYWQKAWENWEPNERIHRDIKGGILRVVTGGIEYGIHTYRTTDDMHFIPRLFNAGMLLSTHIMSGLLKLLFTAEWWKVLLTILGVALIMSVPFILINLLYSATSTQRNTRDLGIIIGFWNLVLIFIAYCNDNPVWVNNVGALWFSESSYGIQPYLCVLPNLFFLVLLLGNVAGVIYELIKKGKGVSYAFFTGLSLIPIFFINYIIAGMAGLFYLFIILLFILVKSCLSSIPDIIGGMASGYTSDLTKEMTRKEKYCCMCSNYNFPDRECSIGNGHKDRYDCSAMHCHSFSEIGH